MADKFEKLEFIVGGTFLMTGMAGWMFDNKPAMYTGFIGTILVSGYETVIGTIDHFRESY